MPSRYRKATPQNFEKLCKTQKNQLPTPDYLRFLNKKLKARFQDKNIFFQATYVTAVRDWCANFKRYSSTYGAYRKRSAKDKKIIPHSFTFIRRDCP